MIGDGAREDNRATKPGGSRVGDGGGGLRCLVLVAWQCLGTGGRPSLC